jgi:hypothetical protein
MTPKQYTLLGAGSQRACFLVGNKDKAKAREDSLEGETVDDGAVLPPEERVVTANKELPKEAARTASKSSKEKGREPHQNPRRRRQSQKPTWQQEKQEIREATHAVPESEEKNCVATKKVAHPRNSIGGAKDETPNQSEQQTKAAALFSSECC